MEALTRTGVEWGVAGRPRQGESCSGDGYLVRHLPQGTLLGVVDGLGHGPSAATAARLGIATLQDPAPETLAAALSRCHERLRGTRGATISLALFSDVDDTMTWLGVGDVTGLLVRDDPGLRPRLERLILRAGVVGLHLPPLHDEFLRLRRGDTLVLATDGIRRGFDVDIEVAGPPGRIAQDILARFGRDTDDALVLAARYLGHEA